MAGVEGSKIRAKMKNRVEVVKSRLGFLKQGQLGEHVHPQWLR